MYICNDNKYFDGKEQNKIIIKASKKYKEFMEALRIDVDNDPNSKETPIRVAKMFVNELCQGRYNEKPDIKSFPNTQKYDQIIFTNCEGKQIIFETLFNSGSETAFK